MKKIVFLISLIVAALVTTATAIATEIPNFIYNSETDMKIEGNLPSSYAGSFVTVMLKNEEGIGYVGQAEVEENGSYTHLFKFGKNPGDYVLKANVGGELIDENTISMYPEKAKLNIDVSLVQNENVADVLVEIGNYYGIYKNDRINYNIIIATYDEKGRLQSASMSDTASMTRYGSEKNIFSKPLSLDNVQVKAFVWKMEDLEPLAASESIYATYEGGPDIYNVKGSEWQTIGMRTAQMKEAGLIGGEGAQRIMSLAISKDDSLILAGNDTGGINRSTDGGETWEDVFGGFLPGGSTAIAIDPMNKNNVIAAGNTQITSASNITEEKSTGLYLSTDAGYSWKQVLSQPGAVTKFDMREAICYDPSSYDAEFGGCKVAYWSRPWNLQADNTVPIADEDVVRFDDDLPGLWKTTDGGKTWQNVNSEMSDGCVKVHPTNGTVYVANIDGFHRSTDGGKTFEKILSERIILGLDVIDNKDYHDYVWVCDGEGLWISKDCGKTFSKKDTMILFGGYPSNAKTGDTDKIVRSLKVSPVNPENMVLGSYNGSNYENKKYYTNSGGYRWAESSYDDSKDFFKANNRHPVFVWSNSDEDKVWSIGGDWVTLSENAGQKYAWNYDGGADVFVDQRTIFNVYDPSLFYYGSQDFHGAFTKDAGDTWKHILKVSDSEFAGYVYGSYAADENTLIAIVQESAGSTTRKLKVSRDGGETWEDTGREATNRSKPAEMCYQSPTNPNVLFAAYWRSTDYGYTWSYMSGVEAVCAHNPNGKKELYGYKGDKIKVSYDNGETWSDYATVKTDVDAASTMIWDIAYDGENNILYYVSGNGSTGKYFCKVQDGVTYDLTSNVVADEEYGRGIQLCAVDPINTNVVYVGGYMGKRVNPNGVQRSCDGGKTFQVLTTNSNNSVVKGGIAGGLEPYDLIVHPTTGELWVSQGCNGWAKFPSPYAWNEE